MSKKQTKLATTFSILCCFAFIFSNFSSCEVGLGSSVDTEAPEITIVSPSVGSIIRDKFALSGRWGDDGSVADIWVTLKRTDGKTDRTCKFACHPLENRRGNAAGRAGIQYKRCGERDGRIFFRFCRAKRTQDRNGYRVRQHVRQDLFVRRGTGRYA